MKSWKARPKEEAYLLNPAFCSTVLTAAILGFKEAQGKDVPFPLTFMFLPLVLHKRTRENLPPNTRTSMAAWLQTNTEVKVLFYERLISLKPYTKEAIRFAMMLDRIRLKEGGLLETTMNNLDFNRATQRLIAEPRECVMRARFLGKWFAAVGSPSTVMAFWGIRP